MNDKINQAYIKQLTKPRIEQVKQLLADNPCNEAVIADLLVMAFIDEQLAQWNYMLSYNMTVTEGKTDYDPEFKAHQQEQRQHKHMILQRLTQIVGPLKRYFSIDTLSEFNSQGRKWVEQSSNNSYDILLHRLKEQEQAVQFYQYCVQYTENCSDSTTNRLFKKIKQDEQKHVKDLKDLANQVRPGSQKYDI